MTNVPCNPPPPPPHPRTEMAGICRIFLCSFYQVLVRRVKDWSDTISDWTGFGPDFYITAQILAATVNPSKVFVVGDGKKYNGYDNKKLLSGQKYMIYSRALTSRNTKV